MTLSGHRFEKFKWTQVSTELPTKTVGSQYISRKPQSWSYLSALSILSIPSFFNPGTSWGESQVITFQSQPALTWCIFDDKKFEPMDCKGYLLFSTEILQLFSYIILHSVASTHHITNYGSQRQKFETVSPQQGIRLFSMTTGKFLGTFAFSLHLLFQFIHMDFTLQRDTAFPVYPQCTYKVWRSRFMSLKYLRHTSTKEVFIAYLKFKYNWMLCVFI